MNIPQNLRFTKDHEWIKLDGNVAVVGITDFAQGELGDIVFVEIETLDEHVEHGETFGTIEAVKTVSDLFMPVSGKIIEVNAMLADQPEVVNKDPYGDGWMVKIEVDNVASINELLTAAQYQEIVA